VADHAIAGEEVRHAQESVQLARAALTQAERQSLSAHALVDGTPVEGNPAVLQAKDAYRDAWIAAQRNAVVAPVSGYVAERSVQLGQHIQAGEALMTVIPLPRALGRRKLQRGATARPAHRPKGRGAQRLIRRVLIFHGHVEGMSAGTGAAFSLLPPQNASGNWIKVVQRVPVRILIDDNDLVKSPLRVGLSATVTVDTTSRDGPVLACRQAIGRWAIPGSTRRIWRRPMPKPTRSVRRNLGMDH